MNKRTSAQLERSKSRNTRQMPATWRVHRMPNEQPFSTDLLDICIAQMHLRVSGVYSRN